MLSCCSEAQDLMLYEHAEMLYAKQKQIVLPFNQPQGNMDMAFFQKSTDQQMNFPAIAGTGPTNLHTHQFYDGRRIGHWIFLLLSGSSIIFLGRKNGNTFPLGSSSMANHGG
ncbi:hypothetical protein CY35_09G079000 [Sphagnum magellanicum]|nr:hypothetical protein CY35_09G079000 [Sphagnum magellanicum]